jgi:hypothetical protein
LAIVRRGGLAISGLPLAGEVKLKIYDMMGREISTLLDQFMNPGTYNINFKGDYLPSGTYIYRIFSPNYSKSGKILLMK